MRVFLVTLTIALGACMIRFIRQGADFHIARILPFAGGHPPGLYDVGAIVMILMIFWGLGRLRRSSNGHVDRRIEDEDVHDRSYDYEDAPDEHEDQG